jgi:hypothetical protein
MAGTSSLSHRGLCAASLLKEMTATRVEHERSAASFHEADIYLTLVPCPSWTHRARQQLDGWLQKDRISDARQMRSAMHGLFGARAFSAPMIW